jgi:hypothetical protein
MYITQYPKTCLAWRLFYLHRLRDYKPRDVGSDFRFGNFLELNGANGTDRIATQSDASLKETVASWGK